MIDAPPTLVLRKDARTTYVVGTDIGLYAKVGDVDDGYANTWLGVTPANMVPTIRSVATPCVTGWSASSASWSSHVPCIAASRTPRSSGEANHTRCFELVIGSTRILRNGHAATASNKDDGTSAPARKDLRDLWADLHVAQEVGAELGRGPPL